MEAEFWEPASGVQYYGRGPLQLSWNLDYGQFSTTVNNGLNAKDVYLSSPDDILASGYLAFSSAFWFYMTP